MLPLMIGYTHSSDVSAHLLTCSLSVCNTINSFVALMRTFEEINPCMMMGLNTEERQMLSHYVVQSVPLQLTILG